MKEILQELNTEVGVKGSLLLTSDGLVITADVRPPLDGDAVAAVVSATLMSVRSALKHSGLEGFSKFICNSRFGKMVFVETGDIYLVAVLDKTINLDYTMLAVSSAAHRVKTHGHM